MSGLRVGVYLNPEKEPPRMVYLDLPKRDTESITREIVAWLLDDLWDECPTGVHMTVVPIRRSAIENGRPVRKLVDLCRYRQMIMSDEPRAHLDLHSRVWQDVHCLIDTLDRQELWAVADRT